MIVLNKTGYGLISLAMTGTIISGSEIIKNLNENAPAYGLLGAWAIGGLGVMSVLIFGLWKAIRDKKADAALERHYELQRKETERSNRAMESRGAETSST